MHLQFVEPFANNLKNKKMWISSNMSENNRAVMVERSRASINRSSHAQGRGFEPGHSRSFFGATMFGNELIRDLFREFLDFPEDGTRMHGNPNRWNGQMDVPSS